MLEGELVARPLSGNAPVHLYVVTHSLQRGVPAWKEMTHRHHRPGLLGDRRALSDSETLEPIAAELVLSNAFSPVGDPTGVLGAYLEAT